jgi:SAM-dependent methyltransferase
MAAQRGATISGFDASDALLAIARERCPQGDFRAGDMEALPYPSNTFDVVTAINSFCFAANPVQALREARRVARPGAPVAIAVWGKPQDREVAPVLSALTALLPPPATAPPSCALHEPTVLEALAMQAGLTPAGIGEITCVWDYPDEQSAVRGILAAGVSASVIQYAGEEHARNAVTQALAPFKKPSGHYQLRNTFLYLITKA